MNKKILLTAGIILIILILIISFSLKKGKTSFAEGKTAVLNAQSLLNQARDLQTKGDLLGLAALYQKLVSDFPNSAEVMNWQKKIDDINIRLLFSPTLTPKSAIYEIKPGDTLSRIAKAFKTTPELIKKSNNLKSDMISPGKKLKVWNAPFSILVDKSQNILILKSNEEIVKTYIVSTGKDNTSPVGNFKITSKLVNPTWFKTGAVIPAGSPENVLGTRWLGIDKPSYGIHGTTDPQDLGKQVTQGCVRMANSDVEELYTIVPIGTEVVIVD
ncbi:MAG: L,D-transpeptidase family protein [Candidatus Omnitrophota bacterium]|nr:L,D-transpeptidase family protein [Candidatus Omnitrophota bacterium]